MKMPSDKYANIPFDIIKKLAQSKTVWLKDFKQECIQNREDKKPKKQEIFHEIGVLPKKIIIEKWTEK